MSSVQQNIIKHKVGLLNLAVELGNVSKACQVMGMSRDTFYRYRNAHVQEAFRLCSMRIAANPFFEIGLIQALKARS